MTSALESFIWLITVTVLMLLLKRWLHRHVQGIGLLLTGNPDGSFLIYYGLLFPGTVVHELSHYLVATLLNVRVRKFSLIPARQPRGMLRLGFVEIDRTDTVREALIGLAPLIAGSVIMLFLAPLNLPNLESGVSLTTELGNLVAGLPRALTTANFWLWLYAVFAISNGMLPSESDRQAWKPILIWFAAIAAVLYLSGAITTIPDAVDRDIASAVRWIVRAFALAIIVDAFFVPIIFLLEQTLETVTGRRVRY